MATIPKKLIDRFTKTLPKFQKVLQIAKDRDINESDTVSILNDIVSELLGYEKYLEITSEFAIRGTYCDLALRIEDKVQFIVEAKAIGIDLKEAHMKQACDYGANHGVQWIILTNAIKWKLYRIRFEQPINYDLVATFDLLKLNLKTETDINLLYILSKEGLLRNVREDHYEKVQSFNRYVIGQLLISEPSLTTIRRELRKIASGLNVSSAEIADMLCAQVIKREILEGDKAEAASQRINKFYKKTTRKTPDKKNVSKPTKDTPLSESVTDRLLRESVDQS